jgi:hypothetical protein
MSLMPRRLAAGVATVVIAGSALLTTGGAAHATTPPPWEPDPSSVGGLQFFDALGNQITGGSVTDAPIAAYVEGTATIRAGDSKAQLRGFLPVNNGLGPASWTGEPLSGSTSYPLTKDSVPTPPVSLQGLALPINTGSGADDSVANLISDFPNNGTGAYAGLYQLRLYTTALGQQANTTYDSADILITGSGDSATWSVAYTQAAATSTTTTLTVSPSSSAFHGATVKLSATVSPSNAAGSVKFLDGSKKIATVKVKAGKASFSTTSLSDATHKLKATFTPTDATAFAASTSSVQSLIVKAYSTSVTLKASKSSIKLGKKLTLTVKETPAVAGKAKIYDGSKKIATVTVKNGKAPFATTKLKAGKHSLKAKFSATDSQSYSGSTSKAVMVTVKK